MLFQRYQYFITVVKLINSSCTAGHSIKIISVRTQQMGCNIYISKCIRLTIHCEITDYYKLSWQRPKRPKICSIPFQTMSCIPSLYQSKVYQFKFSLSSTLWLTYCKVGQYRHALMQRTKTVNNIPVLARNSQQNKPMTKGSLLLQWCQAHCRSRTICEQCLRPVHSVLEFCQSKTHYQKLSLVCHAHAFSDTWHWLLCWVMYFLYLKVVLVHYHHCL